MSGSDSESESERGQNLRRGLLGSPDRPVENAAMLRELRRGQPRSLRTGNFSGPFMSAAAQAQEERGSVTHMTGLASTARSQLTRILGKLAGNIGYLRDDLSRQQAKQLTENIFIAVNGEVAANNPNKNTAYASIARFLEKPENQEVMRNIERLFQFRQQSMGRREAPMQVNIPTAVVYVYDILINDESTFETYQNQEQAVAAMNETIPSARRFANIPEPANYNRRIPPPAVPVSGVLSAAQHEVQYDVNGNYNPRFDADTDSSRPTYSDYSDSDASSSDDESTDKQPGKKRPRDNSDNDKSKRSRSSSFGGKKSKKMGRKTIKRGKKVGKKSIKKSSKKGGKKSRKGGRKHKK
jgi:hypothetical protein